jgi:preprotein translocase subunit YajC
MDWLAQQSGSGGGMSMIMMMVPIFIIMYVLMIRPQKKKEKERKEMIANIKKNDRVVTIGGIHGTVVTVKDNEAILKVDESSNTRLKFSLNAIARVVNQGDDDAKDGE